MSCLNCNKQTEGTQVFCEECMKAMEEYPVDKRTPVVIPAQPSPAPARKQSARMLASVEESLEASQKLNRYLALGLIILSLLLVVAAVLFVYMATSGGTLPALNSAINRFLRFT